MAMSVTTTDLFAVHEMYRNNPPLNEVPLNNKQLSTSTTTPSGDRSTISDSQEQLNDELVEMEQQQTNCDDQVHDGKPAAGSFEQLVEELDLDS